MMDIQKAGVLGLIMLMICCSSARANFLPSIVNGNIGIGSTAPGYKLDVVGQLNASGGLCINGTCQTTWSNVALPAGTNGNTLYNSSGTWTVSSNLYNNGTNVGIGTTSPQGGLVVMNGNVGVGTWMPQALLDVSTGGGNPSFLTGAASKSVYIQNNLEVDGSAYLINATIGSLTLSAGVTSTGGNSTFNQIQVTGQSLFNTVSGNVGIGTTMTGASATTKLAVIGGNVGIGSVSPGQSLDVQGSVRFSGNGYVGTSVLTPANTVQSITATGGLTSVTNSYIKIVGSPGAVSINNGVTQIPPGIEGQELILYGTSSTNTVQFHNGDGLLLNSGVSFTMGNNACIRFIYNATSGAWREVSREV